MYYMLVRNSLLAERDYSYSVLKVPLTLGFPLLSLFCVDLLSLPGGEAQCPQRAA
jgi:hypothetical protein